MKISFKCGLMKYIITMWLLNLIIVFVFIDKGHSICYFPGELQGGWATQLGDDRNVSSSNSTRDLSFLYSYVNITHDRISTWGHCYQRVYNNLILAKKSGGGYRCYRCFRLAVASVNVISIVSSDIEACHITLDDAILSCPTHRQLVSRAATEIMMYKMRTAWGEPGVTKVECPLNGVYTFTYDRGIEWEGFYGPVWRSDDRRFNDINHYTCEQPTSELSNCPHGYGLTITYRDCSFSTQLEQKNDLQCLGSWKGVDGQNYFAVLDTSVGDENRSKYKCGIYKEEAGTGRVYITFSRDSTCTSQLESHKEGFERYVLKSVPAPPLPIEVSKSQCSFPESLYGHWHHTYIEKNTVVFKDYANMKTYSATCVLKTLDDEEKFIVYAQSHCMKRSYNCLWLKRRSANILEFMLGLHPSETFQPDLCDVDNFGNQSTWTTQPKSILETPTVCPILGYYEGELPTAPGFCAQLYSDCQQPSRMFYAVNLCSNTSEIFEQRDYQCLGEWRDYDDTIYALTYRRDIHTYECFVGHLKEGEIYIKEAGETCIRGLNPRELGMKLQLTQAPGPCALEPEQNWELPERDVVLQKIPPTKPPWLPATRPTMPWKLITAAHKPKELITSGSTGVESSFLILPLTILLFLKYLYCKI